jgi:protein-disulfide isomerase
MLNVDSSNKKKRKSVTIPIPPFDKLTPFLIVVSIGLAFAVGILWQRVQTKDVQTSSIIAGNNKEGENNLPPQQPPPSSAKDVEPVSENDHVRGNRNARIALIEYSDLECPFCAQFHPTAIQVLDEYGDQVSWVYRHFPLDQIHPKARPAAEASECISELGGDEAFWKFVDEIFADQRNNLSNLDSVVSKLGLDQKAYNSCVDSKKYAQKVEDNLQSGINSGVTGTPGNILLDTKTGKTTLIPGALPFEQVKQSIDSILVSQ